MEGHQLDLPEDQQQKPFDTKGGGVSPRFKGAISRI